MELPIAVRIHNEQLGLRGVAGTLLQISPEGFYLLSTLFGDNTHKLLLPIQQTALIFEEPEVAVGGESLEIER